MVRLVAFPDEGIAVLQTRGYRFFPLDEVYRLEMGLFSLSL